MPENPAKFKFAEYKVAKKYDLVVGGCVGLVLVGARWWALHEGMHFSRRQLKVSYRAGLGLEMSGFELL